MVQSDLAVFLYFLAEDEYDGEYTGEVNELLVSDGKDLSMEWPKDRLRELMLWRQETGEYKIYGDYFRSYNEDEIWDADGDGDRDGGEDEKGEGTGEACRDGNPWSEEDVKDWNKGRSSDWLYEELEEVVLPESLTDLGEAIFQGCEKLKSLTVPESVVYIGLKALPNKSDFTIQAKEGSAIYHFAKAKWGR